jgi:AcrR family transcriptional regulator
MAESRRAAPLPPEERRAAILAATVPLLRATGGQASTKELAAAAGVAEGTLFRVFPDKHALLVAAISEAIDPTELVAGIESIDPHTSLTERIGELARLLGAHVEGMFELGMLLKQHRGPSERSAHADEELRQAMDAAGAAVTAAIARMLLPDRDALSVTPDQAAAVIGACVAGNRLPGQPAESRLSDEQLAHCVVHGIGSPRPS